MLQQLRHVFHPQVNAQVRFVGAELLHGLQVGDAPKRRLRRDVVRSILGEDGGQHLLHNRKHVLLAGEGHLHVQLVKLAGRAVAPGVLVPEARGNLEILVKAGGHQQLLELLGRLGQGVELARMLPGRHQVIPGSFGRGSGEDRGGNLQKALVLHGTAQGGHHLAAQHNVSLHLGVAQIQIAVFQPGVLPGVLGVVDFKGQLVVLAAAQQSDLAGGHLNVPGGQLGVLAGPLPHHAGDSQGALLVQGLHLLHHLFGFDDHLGGAVKIPQHQKAQVSSHFPQVFHPARQSDGLAHLLHAKLPTGVGSVFRLCHNPFLFPFLRFCSVLPSRGIKRKRRPQRSLPPRC